MRQSLVLVHRWAGLITALFLLIVGLTGAVIAFEEELECWLNPQLFVVTPPLDAAGRPQPMMDPFELRERTQRALPDHIVNLVRFEREPDRSVLLLARARPGATVENDQVFVNPYTGEILGMRKRAESLFKRETVVSFIYVLHYSLALPGRWGTWLLGVIAIVWTVDSFAGFMLTLPRGRPFWSKWSVAWKIKRNAAALRLNLDLHRAFSLWLFAVLLIFAWSSVMLNLRQQVYRPVMSTLFEFAPLPDTTRRSQPLDEPALDYRAAADAGNKAMQALAREKQFTVNFADNVSYNRAGGFYIYNANTSRDLVHERGQTLVYIDGNSGATFGARVPTGEASGDTISRWLQSLHMAQIFGRPYQIFVAVLGVVVAMLSVTGIVIWWNKRRARTVKVRRSVTRPVPAPSAARWGWRRLRSTARRSDSAHR